MMKSTRPVLENPRVLRLWVPIYIIINILLSAYFYSNFNNLLTLLPALFGIGTGLYVWWQAGRIEQADASKHD
ncbi:MAG: hypothetical protein LCI00_28335 [Chloroflexi bacterium]|nr:hypothetical protein [Chloroflexota bacterium]